MCWGEGQIILRFYVEYIPPILLKHLRRDLMSILVLDSYLNDISPERNFENQFRI